MEPLTQSITAALLLLGLLIGATAELRAQEATTPKIGTYPAVEDLPPKPEKPGMTVDEQSKLKQELINARDRQTPQAKARAKEDALHPKSKKPWRPGLAGAKRRDQPHLPRSNASQFAIRSVPAEALTAN